MATILVVDDEPETRVLLNAVLGDELGHSLVFAPDGEAAIVRYNRMRPDIVITDLVMPKLNGLRLIRELKTMDSTVRIIAVSGKAPEQLAQAEAAGAVVTLPKPLRREALVAAIARALEDPEPVDWAG